MSDYIGFDAVVEPLEWGKATYTILRLPSNVSDQLQAEGAKRVEGEINDHPVNLALTKAPVVDGYFLWAGKKLLNEVGIEPGERLEVRLRKAEADDVETPGDVAVALRSEDVSAAWEALTAGRQRSLLYTIDTAKRPETRKKRIIALVETLRGIA